MKTLEQPATLPGQILRLLWGQRASQALAAAVNLDLFTALEEGGKTAGEVAASLSLDLKGVALLLDCVAGLELIERKGDRFELTEMAREYLSSKSDLNLLSYIKHGSDLQKRWEQIPEAVATGKPVAEVNRDETAAQFFPALAEAIFPTSYSVASLIASKLSQINQGDLKLLDVAAGSGAWSIPFAERNKNAAVVALDFHAVLEVTRKIARRHSVSDQYSYLSGNWRDVPWEHDTYDIATLGHILHSEGKETSRKLLKNCHSALKKGGRLIVAEFLSRDDSSGPLPALLFALNMYILTTDGCVFSRGELKNMIEEAGFSNFTVEFDDENSCTVVSAVK